VDLSSALLSIANEERSLTGSEFGKGCVLAELKRCLHITEKFSKLRPSFPNLYIFSTIIWNTFI
jgi:hypothetical protein